jgi:hypothetical protein
MRLLFLALPVAAVAVLSVARRANACSGLECIGGPFVPASGTVPATLPALRWQPRALFESVSSADVELVRLGEGGEVSVPVAVTEDAAGGFVVTPVSPLEADADYVIRAVDECASGGVADGPRAEAALHTGPAAASPTTLGEIVTPGVLVEPLDVRTQSGTCYATISAAKVVLSLTLSADSAPWQSSLILTALVDGNPWPGPATPNATVLYAQCASDDAGADPGLSEGIHTVVIRGSLPGSDVVIESSTISVDLDCTPPAGRPFDSEPEEQACSIGRQGSAGTPVELSASMLGVAAAFAIRRARRRARLRVGAVG